jgi:hypothetical protein
MRSNKVCIEGKERSLYQTIGDTINHTERGPCRILLLRTATCQITTGMWENHLWNILCKMEFEPISRSIQCNQYIQPVTEKNTL